MTILYDVPWGDWVTPGGVDLHESGEAPVGGKIEVQAVNSVWPANDLIQIPTHQLGEALFGYGRPQAMRTNDSLVAASLVISPPLAV